MYKEMEDIQLYRYVLRVYRYVSLINDYLTIHYIHVLYTTIHVHVQNTQGKRELILCSICSLSATTIHGLRVTIHVRVLYTGYTEEILTGILREIFTQIRFHNLVFKEIGFIKKQNRRCLHKPRVANDGFKQGQTLFHSVLIRIFKQCLHN